MLIINFHDTKCYGYKAYDKSGPKIDDMKKKTGASQKSNCCLTLLLYTI